MLLCLGPNLLRQRTSRLSVMTKSEGSFFARLYHATFRGATNVRARPRLPGALTISPGRWIDQCRATVSSPADELLVCDALECRNLLGAGSPPPAGM